MGAFAVKSTAGAPVGATRVAVTASFPADTTSIVINFYNGATHSSANLAYWDGIIITEGSAPQNFADGDSPGWAWTGTPNASASTGSPL